MEILAKSIKIRRQKFCTITEFQTVIVLLLSKLGSTV